MSPTITAFKASPDRGRASLARARDAAPSALEAPPLRVDVRGLRADEAVREVESFLDQAFRNGDPGVLVLHGHGTGALRDAIRAWLRAIPGVEKFEPGSSRPGPVAAAFQTRSPESRSKSSTIDRPSSPMQPVTTCAS